ncbi:MAG: delta-60 repeat domain-containing protein, partial [Actinomycetes bacterium]
MSSLIAFSQVTPTAPTSLDEVPASRSRSRHRCRELARSLTLAAAATCALVVMIAPQASAAQRVKVLPGFNGTVNAISEPDSNGTRYIGGAFTAYNALDTGYGAVADTTSAAIQTQFPKVSGGVLQAVAADGSGGWYIGGSFTSVDSVTRNRAAHINSDGSLDSNWNPNLNSTVRALAVSGSTVYLGGDFLNVASSTRNYAAAVSISDTGNGSGGSCITSYLGSGCRMSWNPNLNNAVYALAVSGTTVYLGGNFSTVGGTTRNFAAAVSISDTGNGSGGSCITAYAASCRTSWNPNMNSTVYALAVSGSNVYLGGYFTTAGGTTRNRAAAIATDGTLQDWNPNMNSDVNALAVSGSNVYLGGYFTTAGGTTRNRAAAIATDGTLQDWNPNLNSDVNALAVSGSNVYLGGYFTTA